MSKLTAVPIKAPWIGMILKGSKPWEIRSKFTKELGQVALKNSPLEAMHRSTQRVGFSGRIKKN
jgi:hypothetical protein